MQHGYFDDFRAVRDQHGKIFPSPERLIDAQAAQPFPPTQVKLHSSSCVSICRLNTFLVSLESAF